MKENLVRFSVAIGGELLRRFDEYRERRRFPNRSEAVRGLMRDALIDEAVDEESTDAMGVVTLIYDHHAGGIARRLTDVQHAHLDMVVTTTHVHLDAARCLEVVLVRGTAARVRRLADDLIGIKGVETGRLVLAAAGPIVAGHGHDHVHDDHDDEDDDEGHGHSHPHPHPHPH
ncbi:nickel-responsive transcriptional regulator NikR [Paludisphaera sp.]|uniref:nickel-responsive transcriptional regulator NikR n=1 Tax=Paludisphaera sp. TaxID=2017432 RepID=UPI00301C9074